MKLASSALKGITGLARTEYAEMLPDGEFHYCKEAKAKYFTAGFGKAVMLPDDIKTKKYYIVGILQIIYVGPDMMSKKVALYKESILWLDDNSGNGGHLFVSLDIVGLLNKDVNALKKALGEFKEKEKIYCYF